MKKILRQYEASLNTRRELAAKRVRELEETIAAQQLLLQDAQREMREAVADIKSFESEYVDLD